MIETSSAYTANVDTIQLSHDIVAQFHVGAERTNTLLQTGCTVAVCTYQRAWSLNRFLDSLEQQSRTPDHLLIVDASPNDATERVLRQRSNLVLLAPQVTYLRVRGRYKGLTRQRNLALQHTNTGLIAFFDDDMVLTPTCIAEMERAHRDYGDQVVGVGAVVPSKLGYLPLIWRVERLLGVVPNEEPGRFFRSGKVTMWFSMPSTSGFVEGDWISGCAMMWKTAVARCVSFHEGFRDYALGEDVDFSLRARVYGKIGVVGTARALHLHDSSGRPNPAKLGYMEIYNRYRILRRAYPHGGWRDGAWFAYAWAIDTLLLARHAVVPQRWSFVVGQLYGRAHATIDLLCGTHTTEQERDMAAQQAGKGTRTPAQIRAHYEIEKRLAAQLRSSSKHERRHLYSAVYDEMYRLVPDHPQLSDAEQYARERAAAIQSNLRLLKHVLHRNSVFLELGAGDCQQTVAVARFVRQAYALEVSREIAHRTAFPPNMRLLLSDGCTIDLPDGSVDVVFSDQLMEHLHPDDVVEQLQSVYRVLKPNGLYICLTPNAFSGPHDVSQHFDRVATCFHLQEYRSTELRALMRQAGFRTVQTYVSLPRALVRLPIAPVVAAEAVLARLPYTASKALARSLPVRAVLSRVIATK